MGTRVDDPHWISMVENEAAGDAAAGDVAELEGDRLRWLRVAQALLRDTEDALDDASELTDPAIRAQVTADLEGELRQLEAAVTRIALAAGLGTLWQAPAAPRPAVNGSTLAPAGSTSPV
ncbi:MAG TPA: hypothetical protein VGP53_09970, partial [Acidimicrobiales bacterium]|nr:hypothetical protein [Acidimicrobiales bacterium]